VLSIDRSVVYKPVLRTADDLNDWVGTRKPAIEECSRC